MRINDKLDLRAIMDNGIVSPINIKIDGDEFMQKFGWQNLSVGPMSSLRTWIKTEVYTPSRYKSLMNTFKSLSESEFNTRLGYALEGNIGHSNAKRLLAAFSTQENIKNAAADQTKTDSQFTAILFGFIVAIADIGPDTISDFMTYISLPILKAYTKSVWNTQNDLFKEKYPLSANKTISIEGINLLLIPDSWARDAGYSDLANGTPLDIIKVVTDDRYALDISSGYKVCKSRKSAQSTYTRIYNLIIKLAKEDMNANEIKESIKMTPTVVEVSTLVDIDNLINVILSSL